MEEEYVSLEEAQEISGLSEKQLLRGGLTANYWFYHFRGFQWWKVPLGVIESLYHGDQKFITPFYIEVDQKFLELEKNNKKILPEKRKKIGEWSRMILTSVSPEGKQLKEIREIEWSSELLHLRCEDIYSKLTTSRPGSSVESKTIQHPAAPKLGNTSTDIELTRSPPDTCEKIFGWEKIEQATSMSRKTIETADHRVKTKSVIHRELNRVWAFKDELLDLVSKWGKQKEAKAKAKKAANRLK